MYRILLVDDEIHICQLLEHLIDWKALDAELCGVAHDGVEAYEMVRSLHPHVVLSDIRMSGMDGISLLEKIRSLGQDCAFILISGYRQFEYAQKAIQLGVTDYLVKPISKKPLNAAIAKGLQELRDRGEAAVEPHQNLLQGLESLISIVESNSSKLSRISLGELTKTYGLSLTGPRCVIYGKCVCNECFSPEMREMVEKHVKALFQENTWFENSFCAMWDGGCLLVGASMQPTANLAAIQRQCQSEVSTFPHWRVVLGSSVPKEGDTLYQAAQQAKSAVNRHFFFPSETVFCESVGEADIHFENVVENRPALANAMRVLDAKNVQELVMAGYGKLEPYHSSEALFAYTGWLIDAMNHALSAFTAAHSGLEGLQYLHRSELVEQFYYCSSYRELTAQVCGVLESKILKTRESIEQLENKPIRVIREMVAERYMEHISLNDAAELVNLNPVYLSVLFKRETGINFKDYVINIRMNKAKELLCQGEHINQVAEKVGYQDVKYFSRLFARVVGVNPTQYKKLYQ